MFEASLLEYLLRGLPEGFLFILGGHGFAKFRITLRPYIISSILFGFTGFLIRALPISLGAHLILILVTCVIFLRTINRIPLLKATVSSMIIIILYLALEAINGLFLEFVLKLDIDEILRTPIKKMLYDILSIALLSIIVLTGYTIKKKKGLLIHVPPRENI